MMRIAFLGLGAMGAPMARRLAEAGHAVRGYDLSPAARQRLEGTGVTAATSPRDAVADAELVITMLPDGDAVEAALFGASPDVLRRVDRTASADADADADAERSGAGDPAAALRPGTLLLEMSTSDAGYVHSLARRLVPAGVRVMDVPVARGVREARSGELLVMAGGRAEDFATALPVFQRLGAEGHIHHVGPLGTAIRLKLINNYLSLVNMVVAAEGLTFARMAGIDRDVAVRVLQSTPAGKGQLATNFPRKVLAGDLTPDFPLRMGLKDMTLALKLGAELGAPLYLGAAARQSYSLAAPWGRDGQDCTAMLHLLEDVAGLTPRTGIGAA